MNSDFKLNVEFGVDLSNVDKQLKRVQKSVDKAVSGIDKSFSSSTKDVEKQADKMADAVEEASEDMKDSFEDAADSMSKDAKKSGKKIADGIEDGVDDAKDSFQSLADTAKNVMGAVAGAFAIGEIKDFLADMQEIRRELDRVQISFTQMGISASDTKKIMGMYRGVFGDADMGDEVASVFSGIAGSVEEFDKWLTIAGGAWSRFSNMISPETFSENVVQAIRLSEVTGDLEAVFEQTGIDIESFEAKLAACGTEAEREQLLYDTLNGKLGATGAAYRDTTKSAEAMETSNIGIQDSLSNLASKFDPVKNKVYEMIDSFAGSDALATGIDNAVGAFEDMQQYLNSDSFGELKQAVEDLGGTVKDILVDAWDKVKEKVDKIYKKLTDKTLTENLTKAADSLNEALDGNSGILATLLSNALLLGGAIFGIGKAWDWIKIVGNTGIGLFEKLATGANNFASILSVTSTFKDVPFLDGFQISTLEAIGNSGGTMGSFANNLLKVSEASWEAGGNMSRFSIVTQALKKTIAGSKIGQAVSGISSSMASLGGSLGAFFTNPWTLAIIAAIAAFTLLWKYCDGFKEFFIGLWDKCKQAFGLFVDIVGGSFLEAWESVKSAIGPVKQAFNDIWEALKQLFTTTSGGISLLDILTGLFKGIGIIIGGVVMTTLGLLTGFWKGIAESIKGLVQYFQGVIEIFKGVIQLIVGVFTLDGEMILEAVRSIAHGIVEAFKGMGNYVWGLIKGFVQGIIDFFVKLWDVLVGHSIVPDTVEAIVEWFKSLWSSIKGSISSFVSSVIDKFIEVKNGVVNKITELKDGVKQGMKEVANKGFIEPFNGIVRGIRKGINKIIDCVNGITDALGLGEVIGVSFNTEEDVITPLAKGTGHFKGGTALVGEAGRELVHDRGRTFMVNSASLLDLSAGAKVLSNPKTEKLLRGAGLPAFAKGKDEGFFASVKNALGDLWGYVSNPSQIVDKMLEKFGFDGDNVIFGSIATYIKSLKDKIIEFFTNKFEPLQISGAFDGIDKYITSRYGKRKLNGKDDTHWGIDLAGGEFFKEGARVFSQSAGKVITSTFSKTAGNYIEVQTGNMIYRYLHMMDGSLMKKVGDTVKAGDVLGKVGNTGQSYGAHLHFAVKVGGQYVDPTQYFTGAGYGVGSSGASRGLSSSVTKWRDTVQKYASQYGIGKYTDVLLAIMQQESGGNHPDLMQSSESAGFSRPGALTYEKSIAQGVKHFAQCLSMANGNLKTAVQAYNFGTGFISFANARGGWTQSVATEFSNMMARAMGWKSYGDKSYISHVGRYYPFANGGIVKGGSNTLGLIGEKSYDEAVIPLTQAGIKPLTSSLANELSSILGGSGESTGQIVVEVPVYLDSVLIGKSTAPVVKSELEKFEHRQSRINGRK